MNILNIFRRDDSIERERDAVRSELAETVKERDGLKRDLLAERLKFKNAARDLAALVEENEALKPRATKWDGYLKRSRDRKANKPAPNAPPRAPVSARANGKRAA